MNRVYNVGIDGGTYIGFIICITILMFLVIMRSFDSALRKKFTLVTIAMMIALTAGAVDVHFSKIIGGQVNRYLPRIIKYICEGYMELTVVQIVGHEYKKSKLSALVIPFISISLVVMTAPINKSVFYFTDSNRFVFGPLGYLIFVEAAIYVLMALAVVAKKWYSGYQRDGLMIMFMLAVVSIGVLLDEAGIYNNCTLTSSAIGVLFVYVYMYAERYNVDSVSKCYKRRCFYSDANKYAKTEMSVISMDLNDLKYINDNYGHKAGDVALLTFAQACRSVKNKKFILYRTGGDEFMMLGIKASEAETTELIENIKEKLKETPYTCSFGFQMYKPGADFDAVVVNADKAMYTDKRIYKASKTKRSRARIDEVNEKNDSFSNSINFL